MIRPDITLGILAGGHATRLGGLDKAWLQRHRTPQVLRWRDRFTTEVSATLVSANRDLLRYAAADCMPLPMVLPAISARSPAFRRSPAPVARPGC